MKEKIEGFKIYVDQLKAGHVEKINEIFEPDFLDVKEKDLTFADPVEVKGEAYTAEGNLILHLNVSTKAEIPCSMCNEPVKVSIMLENLYYSEPTSDIKGAIFSMSAVIREAILLETPPFAECSNGKCPKRKEFGKYLSKSKSSDGTEQTHYHPFKDLDKTI